MQEFGLIVLAYLVGSIPTAYVVGRIIRGIDLRDYGSGTLGTANVWEHVGKGWAAFCGVFDVIVKGTSVVALGNWVFDSDPLLVAGIGLAALIGHNWSLYLKGSGGRGVAVGVGAFVVISWLQLAVIFLAGVVDRIFFRRIMGETGIGVLITFLLLPLSSSMAYFFLGHSSSSIVFCVGFAAITVIKRILGNTNHLPSDRDILWQRLVYDRDSANRDNWIQRAPSSKSPNS